MKFFFISTLCFYNLIDSTMLAFDKSFYTNISSQAWSNKKKNFIIFTTVQQYLKLIKMKNWHKYNLHEECKNFYSLLVDVMVCRAAQFSCI